VNIITAISLVLAAPGYTSDLDPALKSIHTELEDETIDDWTKPWDFTEFQEWLADWLREVFPEKAPEH
jgi:hypothetical protein